jgi:hypothetical protein
VQVEGCERETDARKTRAKSNGKTEIEIVSKVLAKLMLTGEEKKVWEAIKAIIKSQKEPSKEYALYERMGEVLDELRKEKGKTTSEKPKGT